MVPQLQGTRNILSWLDLLSAIGRICCEYTIQREVEPSNGMSEYLFSYGTLQPELAPAEMTSVIGQLRPIGRASIPGILYDLGDYPGAVFCETNLEVWGQVFELPGDPGILRQLDDYEEFFPAHLERSQFVRTECNATLDNGRAIKAWVYVYNRDPGSAPRIANGNFAARKK